MERLDLKKMQIPDTPGVYFFTRGRGKNKEVLYVGKATSLRERVASYFSHDLIVTRGARIVDMVTKADALSWEQTDSVLDAIVLESIRIKELQPSANVDGRDDKSFFYAVITDETWPRVLLVRGKDLLDFGKKSKVSDTFGPFPHGGELKEALRIIRKIFPFYDTPRPVTHAGKHTQARIVFNKQIGVYPAKDDHGAYITSIRAIRMILSGKKKQLLLGLTKEMKKAAKEERFEDAARLRGEVCALTHVRDVSLIKEGLKERDAGLRLEAYDVAHTGGKETVGAMVVSIGGVLEKSQYRKFRIQSVTNNDPAALAEMLRRRFAHPEWRLPHAIVIDGGAPQKRATEAVLADFRISIPLILVTKNERHKASSITGARRAGVPEADALLLNAEAHRYVLSFHRARRGALYKSTDKNQIA